MRERTKKQLKDTVLIDVVVQPVFFLCFYFLSRLGDSLWMPERIIFGLGLFSSGLLMCGMWLNKTMLWSDIDEE